MKKLTILRHAKSDWTDRSMRDFDRPVNTRGMAGAALIGKEMAARKLVFDAVIASPATRVTQTLAAVEKTYGRSLHPGWDRRVYLASSVTLADIARAQPDSVNSLMLVGHNPGLEDLILELVPDTIGDKLRAEVEIKFPTAALAQLTLNITKWVELVDGCGRIDWLLRPRDLDASLRPEGF